MCIRDRYDIDATEIQRNDVLYTKFKHNRNPFIDIDGLADFLWGDLKTI